MKSTFEGDDLEPLAALALMISPRSLDRTFNRFGTGICEKHRVGEGGIDQTLGKGLALRAAVQVRHVHQRRRLILYRFGKMRMAVAEQIDRDPRCKIERTAAVFRNQPRTFAAHWPEPATGIDRHQRRDRHREVPSKAIKRPAMGPLVSGKSAISPRKPQINPPARSGHSGPDLRLRLPAAMRR